MTMVAGFLCAVLSTCVLPEPPPLEPPEGVWMFMMDDALAPKCGATWSGRYGPRLDALMKQMPEWCEHGSADELVAALDVVIADLSLVTWDSWEVKADLKGARSDRAWWQEHHAKRIAWILRGLEFQQGFWRRLGLTPTPRTKPPMQVSVDDEWALRVFE